MKTILILAIIRFVEHIKYSDGKSTIYITMKNIIKNFIKYLYYLNALTDKLHFFKFWWLIIYKRIENIEIK